MPSGFNSGDVTRDFLYGRSTARLPLDRLPPPSPHLRGGGGRKVSKQTRILLMWISISLLFIEDTLLNNFNSV